MKRLFQRWMVILAMVTTMNQLKADTMVFPIATNGIDLGGGVGSSGTTYLVGYHQNATNVLVQLVATNGALLGNPLWVGASKGEPLLTFGRTHYLAFWADDYIPAGVDLYGQLVSATGAAVGSAFPLLASASGFQAAEAIAFDGTNFLLVWEYYAETGAQELYGECVNESGTVTVSPFVIGDTATGGASYPTKDSPTALAFGLTNYLFVWQIIVSDSPEEWSTYGALISRNGSVTGPFEISQTNSPSFNPLSVAFDGTNFLVAWNRNIGPGYPDSPNWNIDGRFVAPTGSLVGNEFTMATNEAAIPSLACDGVNYLFTWGSQSKTNLFYEFLNRTGNPVGPPFTVFQITGTNNFGFGSCVYDGTRFFAGAVLGSAGFNGTAVTDLYSASLYGAVIPKSTASPSLAVGTLFGRQFPLTLTGTPGVNYAVQMTTNLGLPNWTAIVTNSPTNGMFSFTNLSATNQSRFYRAVMQ